MIECIIWLALSNMFERFGCVIAQGKPFIIYLIMTKFLKITQNSEKIKVLFEFFQLSYIIEFECYVNVRGF